MIMMGVHFFLTTVHAMPRYLPDIAEDTGRRSGPAYTVTRKLIKAGAFSVSADSPILCSLG